MSPPKRTAELLRQVGEYDILGVVGEGSMGVVYEGRQPDIGKRVALKVLRREVSDDREIVERFLREARAVNEIRHRGIIDIFSFGVLPDGRSYLVMELLEGRSFAQLLLDDGPVDVPRAVDWTVQILEALDAAHEAGVIHRDLKPSNLFAVEHGRQPVYVKLLDFGIAKLMPQAGRATAETRVATIIGTPDYMSPEQVRAQPVTPATDLYALGCVLFELISGRRPFPGRNVNETMTWHIERPAPRLARHAAGVPPELDELVAWLMEKEPAARPASAQVALEHALSLRDRLPRRGSSPHPKLHELGTVPAAPGPNRPTAPQERADDDGSSVLPTVRRAAPYPLVVTPAPPQRPTEAAHETEVGFPTLDDARPTTPGRPVPELVASKREHDLPTQQGVPAHRPEATRTSRRHVTPVQTRDAMEAVEEVEVSRAPRDALEGNLTPLEASAAPIPTRDAMTGNLTPLAAARAPAPSREAVGGHLTPVEADAAAPQRALWPWVVLLIAALLTAAALAWTRGLIPGHL